MPDEQDYDVRDITITISNLWEGLAVKQFEGWRVPGGKQSNRSTQSETIVIYFYISLSWVSKINRYSQLSCTRYEMQHCTFFVCYTLYTHTFMTVYTRKIERTII